MLQLRQLGALSLQSVVRHQLSCLNVLPTGLQDAYDRVYRRITQEVLERNLGSHTYPPVDPVFRSAANDGQDPFCRSGGRYELLGRAGL